MTSQEGLHYNFHTKQVYKSLVALEQFYKEPHWMHNLIQKLNSVTVPVFYLPFPAAVLVYVRVCCLSIPSPRSLPCSLEQAWSEQQSGG